MADEVPIYQESIASAAIDGARIAVVTADVLVALDRTMPEQKTEAIRDRLSAAHAYLDQARDLMDIPTTSIHVVGGGGIIVP
jgi:hypothetical protein